MDWVNLIIDFQNVTLWLCQNSYWKWPFLMGKFHYKWQCSIAMLVYQRVSITLMDSDGLSKSWMDFCDEKGPVAFLSHTNMEIFHHRSKKELEGPGVMLTIPSKVHPKKCPGSQLSLPIDISTIPTQQSAVNLINPKHPSIIPNITHYTGAVLYYDNQIMDDVWSPKYTVQQCSTYITNVGKTMP